jgi:hypothetical protein
MIERRTFLAFKKSHTQLQMGIQFSASDRRF